MKVGPYPLSSTSTKITLATVVALGVSLDLLAQSMDATFQKCRTSIDRIESFEYSAMLTDNWGRRSRIYVARKNHCYRFERNDLHQERKGDLGGNQGEGDSEVLRRIQFKIGFDGTDHFAASEDGKHIRRLKSPPHGTTFIEPIYGSFCWLGIGVFGNRSEIIHPSTWDSLKRRYEIFSQPRLEEGPIATSLRFDRSRFEVIFTSEGDGFPSIIRKWLLPRNEISTEIILDSFCSVPERDAASHTFPRRIEWREFGMEGEVVHKTSIQIYESTIRINAPIELSHFQLAR